METQVREGSFAEAVTTDATGTARRAVGEVVGRRGEPASYAFGWTTGSQPHTARLTIGIGAGSPRGGTFHAVVFDSDDGHAFSLTDEPFARVPRGGPDLDADRARSHEDLPFVWWVADQVMEHDRRARWMRHWLLRTRCAQTVGVLERREPVLLVGNDADDGLWQLVGATDPGGTGRIGYLHHAVAEDSTLLDVLDLPPGCRASRTRVGGPWTRRPGHPG